MEGQGWYLDVMGNWTEEEERTVRDKGEGLMDPNTRNPWRFCKVSETHFFAHRVTWEHDFFAGTLDEVLSKVEQYYR